MIEKIKLHNVATYKNEVKISDLREINFFYGSNGSGKTAISKLIANPELFPNCQVNWRGNNKLKTLVFNEDFVKAYFYQFDELKGIYTIGEGAKEIEEKIDNKNGELKKLIEGTNGLRVTEEEKKQEFKLAFDKFKDDCWKNIYQKYQKDFPDIFKGYGKSKENFANKILFENKENESTLKDLNDLKKEYAILFNKNLTQLDTISNINKNLIDHISELENQQILKTKIIGKEGIDIAQMIQKLQNHDWVRQGKDYFEKNYSEDEKVYYCPFCQQKTPSDFKEKLEKYFGETYENQIKELNKLIQDYEDIEKNLTDFFEKLNKLENQYLNEKKKELEDKKLFLFQIISINKQKLSNKQQNPSTAITLDSIIKTIEEINKIINSINTEIQKYNQLIQNQKNEQKRIESELWKYFTNGISTIIQSYNTQNGNIQKALENINNQIKEKEEKQKTIKNEILELESKRKSVIPTVEAINNLLESFGFSGFRLAATEDEKHYRIVRDDGSSAKETLSEGERNFIVFLYFYHLIHGVLNPEENITQDKIVVFDDPVSSLDSDVLFIVATLIKKILKDIREKKGNINQVFVLTHNVFFFKEVSYISSRKSNNKRRVTKYLIVRKANGISSINSFEENPIKTTYQLLWDEVKRTDKINCVSLQNSMRRIIEFYFKLLADLNEEELINEFVDERDKQICGSLISWINVGSHEVFDDCNYTPSEDIEKFKEIFKNIFEKTGHIAHYNMMMGINENIDENIND